MIPRKLKICKCGCGKEGIIWAKGMLKACYYRLNPPKPIRKVSEKKKEAIKESNNYYRTAIAKNILKNKGKCICDNCPAEIKNALETKGSHVSHIISCGANSALYHHPLNHFIFCYDCENLFSNLGKRSEMKIYPIFLERHTLLNKEYYETN